jgi:hypothetical protein
MIEATMGRSLTVAICVPGLIALSGCGPAAVNQPGGAGSQPPATEYLNPSTTDDLLKSIAGAGLPAPNPRDVTGRDCPAIGCTSKVDTDTVSIVWFPTTGRAELYAGTTHHVFQIEDVVLVFPPDATSAVQADYERAVERAIE